MRRSCWVSILAVVGCFSVFLSVSLAASPKPPLAKQASSQPATASPKTSPQVAPPSAVPPSAAPSGPLAGLSSEIAAVVNSTGIGKMRVGIQIVLLENPPRVVYEMNSHDAFIPASNQKIFTTAAALTLLPMDFRFRTVLARRGSDLVVIGAGDPAFGDPKIAREHNQTITAVFDEWAAKLKAAGVTRITGDLLFDDSIFEQEFLHPNWLTQYKNKLQTWYTAPVGGLTFNDNCLDLVVKPSGAIGSPASVTLIPNTTYATVQNTAKTASQGQPVISRTSQSPVTVLVSGSVSRAGSEDQPVSLTVCDPGLFFATTLKTTLAANGITIAGQVRRDRVRQSNGTLPSDLQVVAVHEQSLLPDIFKRCNMDSQNLFAECLMKAIGAYAGSPETPRTGSYETGRQAMLSFMQQIKVSAENCVFDDGSGLSKSNRATPAALAGVLIAMCRNPQQKEWIATMATPGPEGTLRKRMKDLNNRVYAKTGHVDGVSTLSGYVFGPNNDRCYAFSILCNNTGQAVPKGKGAHGLQDAICRKLATWQGH